MQNGHFHDFSQSFVQTAPDPKRSVITGTRLDNILLYFSENNLQLVVLSHKLKAKPDAASQRLTLSHKISADQ
jgi:hypothetical protein